MSRQPGYKFQNRPHAGLRTEPPPDRLPDGVELTKSELGGLAVYRRDELVGWMHPSSDAWRAYVARRDVRSEGDPIGTWPQVEAVHRILAAYGGES